MVNRFRKRFDIESYWYLIVPLLLATAVLFVYHLRTGITPNRVFLRIAPLNLDIYWYGICIVGGIALGAYVVSRLVLAKAKSSLQQHVALPLRQLSVTELKLPDEIQSILKRTGVETVGDLLLTWGFDPKLLGLNQAGIEKTRKQLEHYPGVEPSWLADAPWRQWNPELVWSGIAWCLILGLIGARLYHVLTPSPSMAALGINSPLDYFRNPYQLINFRNGGLGIYGGIIGGIIGLYIYSKRNRLPMLAWADLATVGMALGQVFGRWGNFFNQELYGSPTELPWGISIDVIYRLQGYSEATRFHPAFLYESLWSLLTFLLLLTLARRYTGKLLSGDLMALYLIAYAVGRSLLETVRLDSRMVTIGDTTLNLAIATLFSIIVAVAMVVWRLYAHLRARPD